MKRILAFAFALALAGVIGSPGIAQEKAAPAAKKTAPAKKPMHVIVNASDLKWTDAPPSFPPGGKMAVLQGDPGKASLFTIRFKAPDGYKVPAHWHPTTEHVTVISGTGYLGTGDKLDERKGVPMSAGAFASMPAKMHHFAWFKGETEIQIHAMGPFQIIYVNPADDPSKATK